MAETYFMVGAQVNGGPPAIAAFLNGYNLTPNFETLTITNDKNPLSPYNIVPCGEKGLEEVCLGILVGHTDGNHVVASHPDRLTLAIAEMKEVFKGEDPLIYVFQER